jgi:hypothetical protein
MTVSAEELRSYLDYNKETGVFTWIQKPARKILVGSRAGYSSVNGYRSLKLLGHTLLEHRAAVLHVTGEWPTHEVDHINRDRADNRWVNLRCVTHDENHQNRGRAHGEFLPGVRPTRGGGWFARIKTKGRQQYLGSFFSEEDAHAAYLRAKANLHPMSKPEGSLRV